jgi:ribosome-binding protein aMBF1 (putative translation factor)
MSTYIVGLDKNIFHRLIRRMSPEQVRAARGWLGWSQQDLAKRASVGLSTVKDFENGNRTPIANNLSAIRVALESAGIKLLFGPNGKATGVGTTA